MPDGLAAASHNELGKLDLIRYIGFRITQFYNILVKNKVIDA